MLTSVNPKDQKVLTRFLELKYILTNGNEKFNSAGKHQSKLLN